MRSIYDYPELESDYGKKLYDEMIRPRLKQKSDESSNAKDNINLEQQVNLITEIEPKVESQIPINYHFKSDDSNADFENVTSINLDENLIQNNYSPSLDDLIDFYQSQGVIGEKKNLILQTLCAINSMSFGVEGYSGSGKTFLVDNLIKLIPEDMIYTIGMASNQAMMNDSDLINSKKFIYMPEIQKAINSRDSTVIEILKELTEGKDARRIVTRKKGKTDEFLISAGKTIIYTLAKENGYKNDSELSRRFLKFQTDSSTEHIEIVLEHKAQDRLENNISQNKNISELKKYISNCIDMDSVNFIDPFAPYFNQFIPKSMKAISFVNHYYNLLNASAKFFHNDRYVDDNTIFVDIKDHYLIHELYYDTFCNLINNLETNSSISNSKSISKKIDWQNMFDSGKEIMKTKLSDNYEFWLNNQYANSDNISLDSPILYDKQFLK